MQSLLAPLVLFSLASLYATAASIASTNCFSYPPDVSSTQSGDGVTHSECTSTALSSRHANANADVAGAGLFSTVTASVFESNNRAYLGVSALASWTQSFVATLSGGTGLGAFGACFDISQSQQAGFTQGRVATDNVDFVTGRASRCSGPWWFEVPFDQPFLVHVQIVAQANSNDLEGPHAAFGSVALRDTFDVYQMNLDPCSGYCFHLTFLPEGRLTLTPIPEPATALPLGILLTFGWLLLHKRSACPPRVG